MATESSLVLNSGANKHASRHGKARVPYYVDAYVDFAAWTTAKGSALAANDILQVLTVPAGTMLCGGGVEVITVTDAGATDLTIDWGYGGNDDYFVAAFDADSGTAAGAMAASASTAGDLVVLSSADTLDVTIEGTSVDVTTGVIRVWALLLDVSEHSKDDVMAKKDYLA